MTHFISLWILLPWIIAANTMKASFYGNSFITMPLQEAKLSTNLRLKFRTQQENAIIFLAAGRTDYCLLKLESGRINFVYKINHTLIELWSPKKAKWNDLQWHDVSVQRYESNLTMQVDEYFIRKLLLPDISELNVHFGTFLGGFGDFSESYLMEIDNFRGCISDVFYNNINILKRAKERTSHAVSVGVTWNCSTEFDAEVTDAISFVEEDSYMIFQQPPNNAGESYSLDIRTIEEEGIIFLNHGVDFALLEIFDAKLRFLLGKGAHVIEIVSHETISDGKWHSILIRYNAGMIEILLDNALTSAPFVNGSKSTIDLDDHYYFGGITSEVRKRAHYKGLRLSDLSFKGCLRKILFNNHPIGLPQMKATQGLAVHCGWNYPCIEKNPCILSGVCRQYGLDEFICYCDQAYCLKADYAEPYKIFTQSDTTNAEVELLRINPMQLPENNTLFLSSVFIEILFDHTKLGVSESAVMFHVVQPPKYGNLLRLHADTGNFATCKQFSLVDLNTDKVKYVHNGMEHFNDHITMDLQIAEEKNVPDYYFGKHRFVLHANITPVNDAPMLHISGTKILRITQGIPKIIGQDLLSVKDPDSPPNALVYSILNATSSKWTYGRFEVNGLSTTKFSQAEINQGSVIYLFNSSLHETITFELLLQVSDGIETSETVQLPISVHPLQLRIVNNTGLVMIHKSSALITPWNLSIAASSDEDSIDLRYKIKKLPQYGSIQKLRPVDSSWVPVDSFTNSQLILGHIRYYHSNDYPPQDEFKFSASFGSVVTQDFDFRITFTKLKITGPLKWSLPIKGQRITIITTEHLSYQTLPLPTFPKNIIYRILRTTKYGNVFVDGHPRYAKEMDSFTQFDIDKNLIKYKTYRSSYSSFIDYLEFIVSVSECDDIFGQLKITFNPDEGLKGRLSYQTKKALTVREGETALLNKANFDILLNTFENLTFIVSQLPTHGSLCNYEESKFQMQNISKFALDKLYLNEVYYCHDNTESEKDSLDVLIISNEDVDFQYVCEILIEITLVNDNSPYRAFEDVFHVVSESSRTITANNLLYLDADTNTNLSDIQYNHVSCVNGEFYKSGRRVDHFTQDDLKNRKIIFKHNGPSVGLARFIVTDGVHAINGVLEIQASDPFITVSPTNASIVQEGKFTVLKPTDISAKTNLDAKLDEVVYTVIRPPTYGTLRFLKKEPNNGGQFTSVNTTSINTFTKLDVERERLVYWNTEVASMDKIGYKVSIKNVSAEGEIVVRIYPAAYWEPLKVQKNKTLYVEESTSVLISRDILEVVHPSISPGDITYLVTTSPLHGYLEIQSLTSDDEYNGKVFDQSAINSEKIFYIQAGVNQSRDYFLFDVTNGISWLRNLMLKIVIIPENLYIITKPLSIVEGKTATLNSSLMQPQSEYYKSKILEYKIIQQPIFGYIVSGKSKVTRFTQKQLESDLVQYGHNGSENSTDSMKLIAITRNKDSLPFTLNIEIVPVNDEIPAIVTNTGLQVWNGGNYVIKNSDIMARDHDSPPENLTFLINHIYGGYLARVDNHNVKIEEFTQKDVDDMQIVFIHDANAKMHEISFIVTDGLFNTTDQILYITANPVMLTKIHNDRLHVFPLTKKQILPEHLQFECSDSTRAVKYNITLPPELGRILYEYTDSGHTREVSEFNQSDIDNGRILYEHITTMLELKTNDSFFFDVYAESTTKLLDQKFDIEVSVSSGGLLRFLPVSKINIDEGGSAAIKLDFGKILEYLKTRAGMKEPELYIESHKPLHGIVGLIHNKKDSTTFYPNDFIGQKVYYFHDHSDTSSDSITMSVYLSQGNILLCNLTIPVSVNPINDQPFLLATQYPHISVVEGENVTITQEHLLTTDADTSPYEIIYEVISGPTIGLLMKVSNSGHAEDLIVYGNQFSQEDINNRRIIYVHYGSARSTTFYFKVSDGKFNPAFEIFNINIQPIVISCTADQYDIKVQQGTNSAILEVNNVAISTNALHSRVMYNITNSPLSGIIIFNHQPTLYFNQSQLQSRAISYMQTDLSKANDTFQVYAYVSDANCGTTCEVKVSVEPFIKINGISITEGDKIRLTSTMVSESVILNKLNRYNPKIHIVSPPKAGTIRKIIRSSGESEVLNDKDVNVFTYKELKGGVVYYVARTLPENILSLKDSFEYLISFKSVQPAQSIVHVEIHSFHKRSGDVHTTINLEKATSSALTYVIIPCALLGLILFVTIVLIVIRFRYKSRDKTDVQKDAPPPLPRPPDFVMLNNNRLYSPSESESIPPTSASTPLPCLSNIPHCKITPVGSHEPELQDYDMDEDTTDELDETQQMVPKQYQPYMEHDDWSSSCDVQNEYDYQTVPHTHQATNPLLRRNQYWV